MTDASVQISAIPGFLKRQDRVVLAIIAVFAAIAYFLPEQLGESAYFTGENLLLITPFLVLSVALAAWVKATGLDGQIVRVFSGHVVATISAAALFGALSPFCSCGVVPLIAGLLAAGVPLAPVMAFWIASPIMDPQMFLITAAVLGLPFAVVKTVAAVVMGLGAGFAIHALGGSSVLSSPLRPGVGASSCSTPKCGGPRQDPDIIWRFWGDAERRSLFGREARGTGWFLVRWLTLAFVLESLMVAYVPADLVGSWLGGGNWWSIPLGVAVGIPAYLNGFAAVPTIDAMINLGMMPGAAMAFLVAGSVTSIPAAMAVFALVRLPLFGLYIGFGVLGALATGMAYQTLMF